MPKTPNFSVNFLLIIWMKRFIVLPLLALLFVFIFDFAAIAQSGVPTNINGTIVDLGCTQTCTNLSFKIPHLKSTTDYYVNKIPYTPYQYVTAGGTEDLNLYDDDQFSDAIDLPFPFCFYDSAYTKVIVGSNGVITFDLANAGCANGYKIENEIPYAPGAICKVDSLYYPRAAIMGIYSDLDPGPGPNNNQGIASPPDKKIEWRVEGTAPYRHFIVSFYHIGTFGVNSCGRITPNDFQIVIYESTGLIEVLIGNKICLSNTNDGRGILGVQNWNKDKGVAAPGKNATVWNANQEAYRFTPSGAGSRFVSCDLLTLSGGLLAKADTQTTSAGLLDVAFNNVCPPVGSTKYLVKTIFSDCVTGIASLISIDTVTLKRKPTDIVTGIVKDAVCAATSKGSITITAPAGSGIEYSIDSGATFQASPVFTLSSGTYTITAKNNNTGCNSGKSFTINAASAIQATGVVTNAACAGTFTGSINVSASLGVLPYTYSINGGSSQASNVFANLEPENYSIEVKDNVGCSVSFVKRVGNGPGVSVSSIATDAACEGAVNGKIIINPANGTAPYNYSLNSGSPQLSNTFSNLVAGDYTYTIKDANGCGASGGATIINTLNLSAAAFATNASCQGSATGTITVTPPANGLAPFSYSLNSAAPQSSNIFPGLNGGINYNVAIKDANGCIATLVQNVTNNIGVTATASTLNAACSGTSTGTIIVNTTLGTAPFTFSKDSGLTYQSSNTFRSLLSKRYNVAVKDLNGCTFYFPATVLNNAGVVVNTVIDKASCATVPNGKITLNPIAGIAPLKYSTDGINFQASNQFAGLFSGIFNITVRDSAGCSITLTNVQVGNAPIVRLDSLTITNPSCKGLNNGTIKIFPSLGVPPYQYALNTGIFQAANVFSNIAAATYTVHIRDNSGCVKDTVISLTQPALLTISTNSFKATCTGNPDGNITVTALGGTLPYLYTSDPAGLSGYQPAALLNLRIGNYTITVKDSKGCTANRKDSVLLLDTMRLELGNDTTFCEGVGTVLQPSTNALTNIFKWTPAVGLSDPLAKNPLASPDDTTKYYLTAKWGICERKDSITLKILIKPIAHAGNDTAVCFQTPAFLRGSIGKVSGPFSYNWSPATLLNKTDTLSPVTMTAINGEYIYTLTVKDNYGCNFTQSDSVVVTVQPIVPAFAGNDTNAVTGTALPHQLQATGGGPGGRYEWNWSPLGGVVISNANIANPTVRLQNHNYIFSVKVTDFAGCVGYDTVKITVFDGPTYYMPTAFSPNGDGRNDIFRPTPVGIASTDYFRIFNRYGELVFETSQWMAGWDGTFKGKTQETGTYVWMIKGKDRKGVVVEQKGTVVLLK